MNWLEYHYSTKHDDLPKIESQSNSYKSWIEYPNNQEWIVDNNGKRIRIVFYPKNLENKLNNNEHCIYHPCYPETFYSSYEFIEIVKGRSTIFKQNNIKIVVISNEESLGTLEAFLLQSDLQKINYEIFHLDTTTEPHENILTDYYQFNKINHLSKNISADIYFIDLFSKMENENIWMLQEYDLHITIHWLIACIQKMPPHKTLVVRMRYICDDNWIIIMQIIKHYFNEIKSYHPRIKEEGDSSYYMIGNNKNEQMIDEQTLILKNNFNFSFWKNYYLKVKYTQNEITQFREIEKKGTKTMAIDPINWFRKMGLYIHLRPNQSLEYISYIIKNVKDSEIIIKPETWNGINSELSVNLKLVKRWLDSKPVRTLFPKNDPAFQKSIAKIIEMNLTTSSSWIRKILFSSNTNDEIISWDFVKKRTNPFRFLPKIISESFGGEMITNAWLKFYEILCTNARITRRFPDSIWKSCHICEAPGAFVSALNHYLMQDGSTDIRWLWTAQSLYSENKKVLGDQFGFMKKYPKNWIFEKAPEDKKPTGDLTNPAVIRAYFNRKAMQNSHLITADGGLPLETNQYAMEEVLMMKLFLGEIIMILGLLANDGCAVIKMFLPFQEALTLSLIYILKQHFDRISIQKPVTSRCHNSEVYLILEGYHPMNPKNIDLLLEILESTEEINRISLVDLNNISFRMFLNDMNAIRNEIINKQINGLINMYYSFINFDERDCIPHHKKWINNYNPMTLASDHKLLN